MIELCVIKGVAEGTRIQTSTPTISIGRSPENTIVIPEPHISRHHGQVFLHQSRYFYRDLNSTHGTRLRRENTETTIVHAALREGDELLFGGPDNIAQVKSIHPDALYADEHSITFAHTTQDVLAPPEEVFARDAKALRTLLRFDTQIMASNLTTEEQLLLLLLNETARLFENLDYAAVLEWRDGALSPYDYVVVNPHAKVRLSRTLANHAEEIKRGFVFEVKEEGVVVSNGEPLRKSDSSRIIHAPKEETSGICIPILHRKTEPRFLQCERRLTSEPFSIRELSLANSMVVRLSDRIANLELVRQNQRLNNSASLGVFAAMIGHDIKNYLFYSKRLSEILTEPLSAHPGLVKGLERARKLAQGMKDLAAPGAISPTTFSVHKLAGDIVSEFNSLLGAQCRFEVELCDDLPSATTSEDLLSRVIWNLMMNAYHTAESRSVGRKELPWVKVRIAASGSDAFSVEISDNAGGIGPRTFDYIQRSFDLIGKVYRNEDELISVVNEISRMEGFTNSVGLFFTAVAVNDMRGTITAETKQGQGTTFRLVLPIRLDSLRNLLRY